MPIDFSKLKIKTPEERAQEEQRQLQNLATFLCENLQKADVPDITEDKLEKDKYSVAFHANIKEGDIEVILDANLSASSFKETEGFLKIHIIVVEGPNYKGSYDVQFPGALDLTGKKIQTDQEPPSMFQSLAAIIAAVKSKPMEQIVQTMREEERNEALRERSGGSTNRIPINLPFNQKDEMKAKFGRKLEWVPKETTWYFIGDKLPDELKAMAKNKAKPKPKSTPGPEME